MHCVWYSFSTKSKLNHCWPHMLQIMRHFVIHLYNRFITANNVTNNAYNEELWSRTGEHRILLPITYGSLNQQLSNFLSEILETVMEDGQTPVLLEELVEGFDETFVKPRDHIVQESLVDVVQTFVIAFLKWLKEKKYPWLWLTTKCFTKYWI